VADQIGEFLAQPATGHPFEAVDQSRQRDFRGEVDEQVHVVGLPVELDQFDFEVLAHRPHDLFESGEVAVREHTMSILGDEN
jgi:hypothetical protein